ncbi:MAG: S41 family peptidase [Leptospira sp.]|nr:S41 family peptidase [Leptospira sp.]
MRKISLFIVKIILAVSFTTVAYCEPKAKKIPRVTKFDVHDFEKVVETVADNYIDKNINTGRAYTDAAVLAMISLPHGLFLYPESYYKEREKYEEADELFPGTTFKISPTDKYIVFDPDYKKVDENRKKKMQAEAGKPRPSNDEMKKLYSRDKVRKSALTAKWDEIKFSKKDFEKVISFIESNLDKYKQPVLKEVVEEESDEDSPKEEFSMKDVYLAASNGYLNSLDPHSAVFLSDAWKDQMEKIADSSFEGIGAILTGGGSREVLVENPLDEYPAVKAGVRAGDVILSVDGKPNKGVPLDKVVKRIKGPENTKVVLLIKRRGVIKPFNIEVVRAKIRIQNVTSKLIKDHEHIAYIKLTGFVRVHGKPAEDSDRKIKEAYSKLEQEAADKKIKLKALVLDLRNNAGGYLDLATDISDMFLTKGVIVGTKNPGGSLKEEYAQEGNELTKLPLTILINAKSASASEIVASAIKHHGRGLLLGERTFGKATVQRLIDPLPGNRDYVLKITQSRYYAPSGQTIQVVGVEPDIEVSAEEDGSFPFQYREENIWQHLPEIPSEVKVKNHINIDKLKDWVKANGVADSFLKQHKNDPIKPDYQLIRSIDYVEAMISQK